MTEELQGNASATGVYDDSSIRSLKGADRIRKRPGAVLGDDGVRGSFHTIIEIVANSMDEARAGFGKKLLITYYEDGSISIRDYGRGVPLSWNEGEQNFNWHLIYNELYAGGKYSDTGIYKDSTGLNGLGGAATQYSSEYFVVESYRDGKKYTKRFEKGLPLSDGAPEEEENTTEPSGTYVRWIPDLDVFKTREFAFSMFVDFLEPQAHLNMVNITLDDRKLTKKTHLFEGKGLEAYLLSKIPEDKLVNVVTKQLQSETVVNGVTYPVRTEVSLAFTDSHESVEMHFHNTGRMQGGVHADGYEYALKSFFKELGKQNDVTINSYDYSRYISVATSTYADSDITSFEGQTKNRISNRFALDAVYNLVIDMLEDGQLRKDPAVLGFIDEVLSSALARKAAKEYEVQRKLALQAAKGGKKRKKITAEKFVPASKMGEVPCELYLVEGDSAAGAVKQARDASFQALMPLVGKPPNGIKTPIVKLLGNKVIKELLPIFGCGVDLGDGSDTFDINDFNWEKLIIATDADVDGKQIRVLVYTIIYRLMPRLITENKVFVVESPLFELELDLVDENGVDVSWFAYSNEERDELVAKAAAQGIRLIRINRSKGLGQNNNDMMWHTTMNPETRRLVPLQLDINDKSVREMTNMLFGDDIAKGRKGFIKTQLIEYGVSFGDLMLEDIVSVAHSLEADGEEEAS